MPQLLGPTLIWRDKTAATEGNSWGTFRLEINEIIQRWKSAQGFLELSIAARLEWQSDERRINYVRILINSRNTTFCYCAACSRRTQKQFSTIIRVERYGCTSWYILN